VHEARYLAAERRLWDAHGVQPVERRLSLARTGATARVQEVGDGPAVVFVHGASNAGASWAPLVARLAGVRCVLLDRPGCGLSEPLHAPLRDLDALATFGDELVADVLDALGLDRAHVVGTSFGGYFALRAAAAHPDRVVGVLEFGWTLGAPVARTPFAMRLAYAPVLGGLVTRVPATRRSVEAIFRSIGLRGALAAGRISNTDLEWFRSLLNDTDTMRNEMAALPPILHPWRGLDPRVQLPPDVLAAIRAPVRLVWGEDDPLGGADIARAFAARMPDAQLDTVAHAGHALWLDDPAGAEAFVRRVVAA
jgi:pimeloyl-ACP methyl ester carboxylesterase